MREKMRVWVRAVRAGLVFWNSSCEVLRAKSKSFFLWAEPSLSGMVEVIPMSREFTGD